MENGQRSVGEQHTGHINTERCEVELKRLQETLTSTPFPGGLIGLSPAMQSVHQSIAKAHEHEFPVVIQGETGTGKELVSRCIHDLGKRKAHPFVAVDCSSLTPTLIESELFGHVRGAFTGATMNRMGLVEAAHCGTLFLDEIAELPKELQPKLLRVIQEREVRPVGSTDRKSVDARIIVATHRNLQNAANEGEFRSDLFYRLNVFTVEMPPLRSRQTDIPLLVAAFIEKHADPMRPITGIGEDFWRSAMGHDWPGNVRELENFVARCIALGYGPTLHSEDGFRLLKRTGDGILSEDLTNLDEIERITILRVLDKTNRDVLAAARMLGIGKTTLYRKLKEYRIDEIIQGGTM